MSFLTVTYDPRASEFVEPSLSAFRRQFPPAQTRKCLTPIPGLLSESFQLSAARQFCVEQSYFAGLPVWIRHGLKLSADIDKALPGQKMSISQLSFGYLATPTTFLQDQTIDPRCSLNWVTKTNWECVSLRCQTKPAMELRLDERCLDRYFVVVNQYPGCWAIVVPLRATPRCYRTHFNEKKATTSRDFQFGNIGSHCLMDSSALFIAFSNRHSFLDATEFFVNVMKLEMHEGPIGCYPMQPKNYRLNHHLMDFWSSYAYQALLSLGSQIRDRLHPPLYQRIAFESMQSQNDQYPNHRCYLKLMAVYLRARTERFFDIWSEYDQVAPLPPSALLDSWSYVPRIYLTPYGIYPMLVKPMSSNRVLRERDLFGPNEHFCRVILRDVDFGELQKDFVTCLKDWIVALVLSHERLAIGNKSFEFLLSSNSQLRDRSFWFYAGYKKQSAAHIRTWMGDFSEEKCVGKYVARMGLTLTGTKATIRLKEDQMEKIDDKLDDRGRLFTDGAGKISGPALREALRIYNRRLAEGDAMPSVVQIRLNGIKGILTHAPDLDDRGVFVQYRPSQEKFLSRHNVLEIVKHGTAGPASLNRQAINLLDHMGVPLHPFLRLQNQARLRVSLSLLADETAEEVLEHKIQLFEWKRMRCAGIPLTREPFARNLLLLLAQEKLRRIREKTSISIPASSARLLMGVVDETDSLDYGQVFIQLRQLDGSPQILHSRQVLITRNPAHFAGDMRKLDAVDCPALHHLYDCVVFPCKGERPHPTEMSGGDTDGDEFWTCWDEEIVRNVTTQHPAAEFDAAEKKIHEGEITMKEVAEFLLEYLTGDTVGILSNWHLALSSVHGLHHDDSLRLARQISIATDFPKTGILPTIPTDIRVGNYPDFMEKKDKPQFECQRALGVMYRQVREVCEIHSHWMENEHEDSTRIDGNFVVPGHEKYLQQANKDYSFYKTRMNLILATYNLTNEYELISACHLCSSEEKKNNDSVLTASLDFRLLVKEMQTRFDPENLSDKEKVWKASAWYVIAYYRQSFLSFGWLMSSLMCSIAKEKNLPTIDHQALKHLGRAVMKENLSDSIPEDAISVQSDDADVKMGDRLLNFVRGTHEFVDEQKRVHQLLNFIHRVALDVR